MVASCYWVSSGAILPWSPGKTSPCAGSNSASNQTQCCFDGDTCFEDGICRYREQPPSSSGFYLGGCTDPTFQDPACAQSCRDYSHGDITYNSTTSSWQCCADDINPLWAGLCDIWTNTSFTAPPPDKLKSYDGHKAGNASTSTSSAPPAVSTTKTASIFATPVTNAVPAQPMHLSDGAKVAVAIGCIFAGFLTFLLITGFYTMQGRWKHLGDEEQVEEKRPVETPCPLT